MHGNPSLTKHPMMTPHCKKIATLAPAVLLAAALASCGGGGSSSGGGGVTPVVTHQITVTSVPVATYTSTDNISISNQITPIRQGTGAGLLAQSTSLDNAASNHANFLVNNSLVSNATYLTTSFGGILGGHYENSALAGYTGASPQARATAAGFPGTVTELVVFGAASGTDCVFSLENSVYHLIDLISPFVDVGIEFNAGNGSGSACVIELGVGSATLGQLPVAGSLVVYPDANQTNVLPTFYNQAEVPVPVPDLPSAGHTVVVSLYTLATPTLSGNDILIHTFSITPNVGVAPGVRLLANTGVTSDGPILTVDDLIPGAGFVVLVPTAPLAANMAYNVSFSATVKGHAVSKTWSFITGNAN
jgi:hypothetical protein